MSLVWEEEWIRPGVSPVDLRDFEWHLKKVWDKDPLAHKFDVPMLGTWRLTLAVVRRRGQRQWEVSFQEIVQMNNDKTFRSLKAAKAYAVAVVTLEQ
jgi:hypothetical protein